MILSKFSRQCQRPLHEFLHMPKPVKHRRYATQKTKDYNLLTAVILNRSPIFTRTPTPFEQTFYDYQARLHRAISNPFPRDFYFKQGSILAKIFGQEERKREILAFRPEHASKVESPPDPSLENEEEEEPSMPRWSAADETNDVKSLERKGERNLYLLVRCKSGEKHEWRFPQGNVIGNEFLHEAAERDLREQCGSNMNIWIVGRRPIGYLEDQYIDVENNASLKNKIFFFKGHIFAGQVNPINKSIEDFAWLTKEEIEHHVEKHYWTSTSDMLSNF